jgi:hypothetical protein
LGRAGEEAREKAPEILVTGEVHVMVMICCSPILMEEKTMGTGSAIGLWMGHALAIDPVDLKRFGVRQSFKT